MRIPSVDTCYEMFRKMDMLEHIAAHSLQVCRVALLLGRDQVRLGNDVNIDLIRAAALLHDITKTRSFQTGEMHSESGCDYLAGQGYPEVGDIVRQHVKLDTYFESDRPSEAEIVNYADKRVLHDSIVSLRERMTYILVRYGSDPRSRKRLNWLWRKSIQQEKRLFALLSYSPIQIESHLDTVNLQKEIQTIFKPRP